MSQVIEAMPGSVVPLAMFILELPVPEFKHKGRTFCNCLLLDRLLVIGGQWEEALQALVVLDYELVIYRWTVVYV